MARRNMSRAARPGTTSGGWCQTRKRPEWLVRLEDGGQEDGVHVCHWQGQVDKGENKDHVEKRAKMEGMYQVKAQVEKKDQATQVAKQVADKCTQTQTQANDFAADMAEGYQRWSTNA